MHRTRASALLLVALAVTLAGCVSENRPEDCDADERTIEVTVSAGAHGA